MVKSNKHATGRNVAIFIIKDVVRSFELALSQRQREASADADVRHLSIGSGVKIHHIDETSIKFSTGASASRTVPMSTLWTMRSIGVWNSAILYSEGCATMARDESLVYSAKALKDGAAIRAILRWEAPRAVQSTDPTGAPTLTQATDKGQPMMWRPFSVLASFVDGDGKPAIIGSHPYTVKNLRGLVYAPIVANLGRALRVDIEARAAVVYLPKPGKLAATTDEKNEARALILSRAEALGTDTETRQPETQGTGA